MAQTFDELGIPFPLFRGPVSEATGFEGLAACSFCDREAQCFLLGVGDDIIVDCPGCQTPNAILADEREGNCSGCERPLSLDDDHDPEDELRVCYGCLRQGRVALTKDTEFGMITWSEAMSGSTHGLPDVAAAGDEDDSPWVRVPLDRSVMLELLRTPGYSTWQGERWLFQGSEPMVYVGTWGREDFNRRAPDGDGQRLFREVLADAPRGDWTESLSEQRGGYGVVVYVFESAAGGHLKAHYDMD